MVGSGSQIPIPIPIQVQVQVEWVDCFPPTFSSPVSVALQIVAPRLSMTSTAIVRGVIDTSAIILNLVAIPPSEPTPNPVSHAPSRLHLHFHPPSASVLFDLPPIIMINCPPSILIHISYMRSA